MQEVSKLETDDLVRTIERLEAAYRAGTPEVSDDVFDHVYLSELRRRDPGHPLLDSVGSEADFGAGKIVHPEPMLTTDKVYTAVDVRVFANRVAGAAKGLGIDPETVCFRLTPKLDGMAARVSGETIVTRGDGLKGNDVSTAFDKGIVIDEPGIGEIVVPQAYFDEHLAGRFEHPRGFVIGCITAETLSPEGVAAFAAGAIRFVNFQRLPSIEVIGETALMAEIEVHCDALEGDCRYPTDGTVVEVVDDRIKAVMGQTSSYHRWQCAKKRKGQSANTTVRSIEWATGRTGRVTPTVVMDPVHLSGATISRVTAHHAGNVKANGIGVGAALRIVRAGEVIPFLDGVVQPATEIDIPQACPSCGGGLTWERDFLVCESPQCEAQCVRQIHHFFSILGNVDLFGEKTVQKLVDHGYSDLLTIYGMSTEDFRSCGFGPQQAENLVAELRRSRTDAVEDWRFLGAMGIRRLGRGSSRRLLRHHSIHVLDTLGVDDIEAIESFGPVVAPGVHKALATLWPTIRGLLNLGFNLVTNQAQPGGPLSGKRVVFTGKMHKPRKEMELEAASLGAQVQKAVSKTTDWLITGERVGATKINKAAALGVTVVPLAEYEARIAN